MDWPTFLTVFSASGIGGVLKYLSLEGAVHDQEKILQDLPEGMRQVLGPDENGAISESLLQITNQADRLKRK